MIIIFITLFIVNVTLAALSAPLLGSEFIAEIYITIDNTLSSVVLSECCSLLERTELG